MAETMVAVLPYISTAASLYSTYQGIKSANMAQQQAEIQQQQYAEEAAVAQANAAQQEADRARELRSVLATQQAMRSGSSLELNSQTMDNIAQDSKTQYGRDIESINISALSRARRYGLAGEAAGLAGDQQAGRAYGAAATGFMGAVKGGVDIAKQFS